MASDPQADDLILFTDVDSSDIASELLTAMDGTARWDVVQELRTWSGAFLADADAVLDVGCGLGDVTIALARAGATGAVGVEQSARMLAVARTRAEQAGVAPSFQQGDALALPFADDQFDAARAERVLQWLDEPVVAVAEMARVTRPGGWVVLLDTDWRTFGTTADQAYERRLMRDTGGPAVTGEVGGFLRSYMLAAGLVDVATHPVVHHANTFVGDGSDGLFTAEDFVRFGVSVGHDRGEAEAFVAELYAQSDAGTLSITLTMWAAAGRVAG